MGGCCCCSSKGGDLDGEPAYRYHPRVSEEHVPLSSHQGTPLSTGLLVDTNLDTSVPDAYRPPPPPIPFDVALGRPQTPQRAQETSSIKNDDGSVQTTISGSVQETTLPSTREILAKCEDIKELDSKAQTNKELHSANEVEDKLSKSVESPVSAKEEEDACPICLEEYDIENPKLTTKCEHHFHLACILEWMERSDMCPVCDKEIVIDPPVD